MVLLHESFPTDKGVVVFVFIDAYTGPLLESELCSLAYLIQPYHELQLLAADSDRLITTLVEYLQDRPDENDDLVQEKHLIQFDRLCESVFLALAGLASNREEIRLKIVSERNMLKSLSEGLNGDNVNIKITAMRSANVNEGVNVHSYVHSLMKFAIFTHTHTHTQMSSQPFSLYQAFAY